jgi:hypothetical protein
MKLAAVLVFMSFSAFAQDSTYTLPIKKARLAIRDAIRSYVQDTIIARYEQRNLTLEYQLDRETARFNQVTGEMQTALTLTEENLADQVKISDRWRREYEKSEKVGKVWKTVGKIFIVIGITEGAILLLK